MKKSQRRKYAVSHWITLKSKLPCSCLDKRTSGILRSALNASTEEEFSDLYCGCSKIILKSVKKTTTKNNIRNPNQKSWRVKLFHSLDSGLSNKDQSGSSIVSLSNFTNKTNKLKYSTKLQALSQVLSACF